MKRIILLLLLMPLFVRAQESEEDSIYSFLNQVVNDMTRRLDTTRGGSYFYVANEPHFEEINDVVFSNHLYDSVVKANINKQGLKEISKKIAFYSSNKFYFKESKFRGVITLSEKRIGENFAKNNGHWQSIRNLKVLDSGRIFCFSIPLFFHDGTKAIFCRSQRCGIDCGNGEIAIYELINGNWKWKLRIASWEY